MPESPDGPGAVPPVVAWLLDPVAYPHPARRVTLIQTHISYVLLAGRHAYKIKKAVDLGFLDYGTLERRRQLCEEEVRLNRRLCPNVYLGVVPVVRAGSGYRIGGDGEAVEYAVAMRRVPERRMMPSLLERGEITPAHIRSLAHVVAAFHRDAPADARIASFGRRDAVHANWDENFAQVRPHIGATISAEDFAAIERYALAFLRERAGLLQRRADEGRVRDVHGDLRTDAVVYDGDRAACIMDCIEFSESLRCGDVASEVAFMAMDLERRGHRVLADAFVALYLEYQPDPTLTAVLRFYRAYRAFVRGKVHSIEAAAVEVPAAQRARALATARRCFALALSYAAPARPRLVVMCGLSGSGKSYVASALAGRIGAAVVSSDLVRKDLLGVDAMTPVTAAYGWGVYTPEQRARVYEAMRERAIAYLREGLPVVLDATHEHRADRDAARALAHGHGVPAAVVHVTAAEAETRARLEARETGDTVSGARWATYLEQRARFEAPTAAESPIEAAPGAPFDSLLDGIVEAPGG